MHPIVMASIAEQRLADLRADRHPSSDRRRGGPSRAHRLTAAPLSRIETRVGTWMVSRGSTLIVKGHGSLPPLRSIPSRAKA